MNKVNKEDYWVNYCLNEKESEGLRIAEQYGKKFAFCGCHKIYILEDENDEKEALENDYNILDIKLLEETYINSCPLKFVSSWNLKITFVKQGSGEDE